MDKHCVVDITTEVYGVWNESGGKKFCTPRRIPTTPTLLPLQSKGSGLGVGQILTSGGIQGYPLQNRSVGQLHTDGGVVAIVRNSAGKLLLVYLSARRLPSSGYYPNYQNGTLSSGF